MQSYSSSGDFERAKLGQRIVDAQELGFDCYLSSSDGTVVTRVGPEESPDVALKQLEEGHGTDGLGGVQFSYERPSEGCAWLGAAILNGANLEQSDFVELWTQHPIDSIASIAELGGLFESFFGSARDWRVWQAFLEHLDEDVSDEVVPRLVIPLLEAGELAWAPQNSKKFLQRRGWSEERINQSFCKATAERRFARAEFHRVTGQSVDTITSCSDLLDAFFPQLCQDGAFSAVTTICYFIRGYLPEADSTRLEEIIKPFLSSFGGLGYEKMAEDMDQRYFDYRVDWDTTPYQGPNSYDEVSSYGTWDDPVTKFRELTGLSAHEIRTTEELVNIILCPDTVREICTGVDSLDVQQCWLSGWMSDVILTFVRAQPNYTDVDVIRAVIEPLIPHIGGHGWVNLRDAIHRHGWESRWALAPFDERNESPLIWGDWTAFQCAFQR